MVHTRAHPADASTCMSAPRWGPVHVRMCFCTRCIVSDCPDACMCQQRGCSWSRDFSSSARSGRASASKRLLLVPGFLVEGLLPAMHVPAKRLLLVPGFLVERPPPAGQVPTKRLLLVPGFLVERPPAGHVPTKMLLLVPGFLVERLLSAAQVPAKRLLLVPGCLVERLLPAAQVPAQRLLLVPWVLVDRLLPAMHVPAKVALGLHGIVQRLAHTVWFGLSSVALVAPMCRCAIALVDQIYRRAAAVTIRSFRSSAPIAICFCFTVALDAYPSRGAVAHTVRISRGALPLLPHPLVSLAGWLVMTRGLPGPHWDHFVTNSRSFQGYIGSLLAWHCWHSGIVVLVGVVFVLRWPSPHVCKRLQLKGRRQAGECTCQGTAEKGAHIMPERWCRRARRRDHRRSAGRERSEQIPHHDVHDAARQQLLQRGLGACRVHRSDGVRFLRGHGIPRGPTSYLMWLWGPGQTRFIAEASVCRHLRDPVSPNLSHVACIRPLALTPPFQPR